MSNDLLITPGSRKQEFKDSSGNIDAKIETDASGNLLITNTGGDISIGDTSSDVFIGDGTNNVDIVFEQDGEIRGTSGVTLTLGASGSNVRLATDLNLNSNEITSAGDITSTGIITTADHFKATGNNLKLHAGGTHVLNLDLNRNVYPNTHNSTDLGFSDSLAFRNFHLVGAMTGGASLTVGNITSSGNVTIAGNLTVNGSSTTLNVATLDVEDKNITLNKGSGDTSGTADGAGITIQDAVNASTDASLTWNAAGDKFIFSHKLRMFGQFELPDNVKMIAGDSEDLQIFHDGSHSEIREQGQGDLRIRGDSIWMLSSSGQNTLAAYSGQVKLYNAGTERLATASDGIDVTGRATIKGTTGLYLHTAADAFRAAFHDDGSKTRIFADGQGSTPAHLTFNGNNVGIKQDAPTYALDVLSTDGPTTARFANSDGEDTLVRIIGGNYNTELDARLFLGESDPYGMTIEYDGAGNYGYIGMNDNVQPTASYSKRIQMSRTGTEVAFTAGNVGIGVAAPTHKLQVAGDIRINAGGALKLYNSAGNAWAQLYYDQTNDSFRVQRSFLGANDVYNLGAPAIRWANVYAKYSHATEGFSSDQTARQTIWRAIDNSGNSGTRYVKICRVTGAHSTRFNIELTGRSTSYGDGTLGAFGRLVGQMNNDNNFDLMFYNYHQGSAQVVNGIGQVDIDTASTDIYVEITSYSEVVAVGVISDGTILPTTGNTGTGQGSSSTPTGYSAVTMQKVIMENASGNVGIGTTAVDEKFQVEGGNIKIEAGAVSTTRGLIIAHSGQTGNQTKLEQLAGGNPHGLLHTTERALRISAGSGGGTGTSETLSFWTNASRAMTIDTSQKVGIGTSSPSEKLVVNVNSSGIKPGIIINNQHGYGSGVGVAAASLQFGRDNSPDNGQTIISGQIYSGNENESTSNPCMMAFSTKSGTSPYTVTERMRISSTGNVGIGSTNPQEKLDVADNTDSSARIGRAHIGAVGHADYAAFSHRDQVGTASYALLQSSSGQTFLNAASGNAINFRIANAGMMVIDSNGRINMGATSSSRGDHGSVNPKLYVVQSGTDGAYNLAARFQAGNDNDNTGASILINHSNDRGLLIEAGRQSSDRGIAYFGILNSGGTNTRLMTLWQDGSAYKVGIGTTAPADRLHISGGNILLNNALEIRTKDTGGNIRTIVRANSSNELEYGWSANAPVKFMGGGSYTERMRIHTTGKVGIGATVPRLKLEVADTANSDGEVLYLRGNGSGGAGIVYSRDDSFTWYSGVGGGSGTGSIPLSYFGIVNRSQGGVALSIAHTTNNVGIGTTAPEAPLHVDKAGAALGSQPSNAAIFDSTGTDGVAQIRVQHLTASTAAALGAGIEFMVGDGTSGSNTKSSYIRQRGGGQLSLDYIADKNHLFYVDHHDNDLTGTGYTDRGTLAFDIQESGNVEAKYNLNVLGDYRMDGTTIVDTSKRVYTSSALYFNSANNSSQIAVDSTVNLRYMGDGKHIFQTYAGGWGTRAEITDSGLNMASGTDILHNGTTVLNGSRYIGNVDRLYLGSTNNFNGNYLSMDASKLMVNDGCDIQLFNSSNTGNGSVHLPRDGMISFYGNSSLLHSISAQNTDSLRINSYAKVDINLDSNGNDTSADFTIGRHAGAANAFGSSDILFRVFENDGDIVAKADVTAFGSFSDRRLKENIKTIDKPIEKVMTLSGVTFNYRDTGKKSTGLIAQDLEEVLPEAVYETPRIDGKEDEKVKAIRYGNTVGLLVEAIKEQQTIINRLEERINTLEKERE